MYKEIDHPCVQHKLSLLRHFETDYKKFRELTTEITTLMCYEALKNLNTDNITIKTPIAEADCQIISDEVVVTPILRAGLGMLDGVLNIIPTAHVGFLGMYRDEETAQPVPYYQNIPDQSSVGLNIIIATFSALEIATFSLFLLKKKSLCLGKLSTSEVVIEISTTFASCP